MIAQTAPADAAALFVPLRPRLLRIAYRMLGSVSDAEDAVQESFLRWLNAEWWAVREPAAFLRRVVTRICLDWLKSARRTRETYVGPWLPEPIVETEEDEVDDVTLPLMLALERLSPLERAAFLLHDVFGVDFAEIAETLNRDVGACRQLASRARTHVRSARPRFPVDREHGLEIASAFFAATRSGDMGALRSLLAEDVTIEADGGGKRSAAPETIRGVEHALKLLAGLAVLLAKRPSALLHYGLIDGLPGFVTREADGLLQTTALAIDNGRINAIYVMRNPDKLAHLEAAAPR
jgi:RNA polymerase sigma-70 factor (ECF subfamily)